MWIFLKSKSICKYAEVKKNPNKFSNKSAIDKWAVIHKSMTPKERREFYKDKKEKPKDMYDDIPKVVMPDQLPMPKIDLEFSKKIFPDEDFSKPPINWVIS